MSFKEAAFERIKSIELSLVRLKENSNKGSGDHAKFKFNTLLKTYLVNIQLYKTLSGLDYSPRYEEHK